jgi:TolB-like protein
MESGPNIERTVPGRWIVLGILVFAGTIVAITGTWLFSRPRASGIPPPSIAVLPFVDMGAEKNQQNLSDRLTEQIVDALSGIPGFRVFGPSDVLALKTQDAAEIGRRLNVRSVLEGSVLRSGDRMRVTAQLINTSDGFHLWSRSFERGVTDISSIGAEISHGVADTLDLKLPQPAR